MKVQYLDIDKQKTESMQLKLDSGLFEQPFNEGLVHQSVVTYLDNQRSRTKGLKGRSDVSGGGAKPWRQKGTGRARAGTIRSPIWRSGGVTFAYNSSEAKRKKMNKKMYKASMNSIFSELLRNERLVIATNLETKSHKTSSMVKALSGIGLTNAVFIADEFNLNFELSTRNIPNIKLITFNQINPVDLCNYENVVITEDCFSKVKEWLK